MISFGKLLLPVILLVLLAPGISAQTPFPDSEIYFAKLKDLRDDHPEKKIMNITKRAGYDNQPGFSPDGNYIYYSSIREDNQADIYRYNLKESKTERITSTPESEYSPTIMPGGKTFSVVRVEKDSTQRVWHFPLEGGKAELDFPHIDSIGYHCWLGKDSAAFFILTNPPTLQVSYNNSNAASLVSNIGRCLKMAPDNYSLSFVEKTEPNIWVIRLLDLEKIKYRFVAQTPAGSEDFAWLPDGTLLMGDGPKIVSFSGKAGATWTTLADLSQLTTKVLRISVSPDGQSIAFVGTPK